MATYFVWSEQLEYNPDEAVRVVATSPSAAAEQYIREQDNAYTLYPEEYEVFVKGEGAEDYSICWVEIEEGERSYSSYEE